MKLEKSHGKWYVLDEHGRRFPRAFQYRGWAEGFARWYWGIW
jgi:hypothetical protein